MQAWTPLLLAATMLLVALVPLALVLRAPDLDKFRKLVRVALFLTFDLIVFGAYTRLTDSGLGCPDWPGCYGLANPLLAHAQITAAEALMPTGPVTMFKAWIEMLHRSLAGAIGVLTVVLMVWAWMRWNATRARAAAPGLPTALFLFICLQGAFGAWTVTMKLQPIIVTTHLLLGMGLLAMLAWLAARQDAAPGAASAAVAAPSATAAARATATVPATAAVPAGTATVPATVDVAAAHAAVVKTEAGAVADYARALRTVRSLALVSAGLLALQIALGGWVSTNYATLACNDYPLCGGQLVPPMDFAHGFTLWRELGKTAVGDYLPFAALTAIHWVHRNFALVVIAALGLTVWRAWPHAALRPIARALAIVVVVQAASGIATIFLSSPLSIAVLHNAGAALLVGLMTMLNYRAKHLLEAA